MSSMSPRTPCAQAELPREGCRLGTGATLWKGNIEDLRAESLSCKPQLFLQTRFTSYIKAEICHFFPKAVKREETISKELNSEHIRSPISWQHLQELPLTLERLKHHPKNLQRSSPKLSPVRVNFRHQLLAEGRLCTLTLFCAV